MAAVLTEENILDIGQGLALVLGTVVISSYTTGGEPIDAPGDLGYRKFAQAGVGGGYVAQWDRSTQKLSAYRQSAATSALTEVPSTTAVTVDFIAVRPK